MGGHFTGREGSVTAINGTSLQTPYSTLREACVCVIRLKVQAQLWKAAGQ